MNNFSTSQIRSDKVSSNLRTGGKRMTQVVNIYLLIKLFEVVQVLLCWNEWQRIVVTNLSSSTLVRSNDQARSIEE